MSSIQCSNEMKCRGDRTLMISMDKLRDPSLCNANLNQVLVRILLDRVDINFMLTTLPGLLVGKGVGWRAA